MQGNVYIHVFLVIYMYTTSRPQEKYGVTHKETER